MFDNENTNDQQMGTNSSEPANNTSYGQSNYGSFSGGSYNGTPSGNYNSGSYNSGSYSQGTMNGNYSSANPGTPNYTTGGQGSYNGGSYGTYQYGSYQPVGGAQPPRKGGKGKKAAIVIAATLILALGLGAGYYSMTRISDKLIEAKGDEDDDEIASADETNEDVIEDADEDAADASQEDADVIGDSGNTGIASTGVVSDSAIITTDVTQVVAKAMPAMVSINNNYTQSMSYFGQKYSQELTASGSGFIVGTNDTELLIATNYHVIEGADTLEVQFVNEKTANAEVKGTDADMDLAVIAVRLEDLESDTKSAIAIAELGDSDSLVLGEPAIAIGNALGYGQSVTTGVISALNRVIELDDSKEGTFIQTNAEINPGNSGGALLNIKGEVVGINSNKIGGDTVEGMGYAIPISTAKPIIEQLMTEKTRAKVAEDSRGYIGISGVSVTSEVSEMYGLPLGVYVAAVSEDGGAKAAGIAEGDIITKFDGKEISSMADLQNRLAYYEAGEVVTVTIERQSSGGYQEQEVQVTLGTKQTVEDANQNGTEGKTYDGEPKEDAIPEDGQNNEDGQNGEGGQNGEDGMNGGDFDMFENPFGFQFNFGN